MSGWPIFETTRLNELVKNFSMNPDSRDELIRALYKSPNFMAMADMFAETQKTGLDETLSILTVGIVLGFRLSEATHESVH